MRKDEFNNYNISNPDGINSSKYNDEKVVFENDTKDFVDEYPADRVDERFEVKETFDSKSKRKEERKQSNRDLQTNTASNVSSASSAASSVASTAASIGGSLGALAGVVAAAVVTAVIVVAVFISTMTMNLSLVMAHTDSLTIQLDIEGAQDEDFAEEIVAILESKDGERQEQIINKDSLYLTFNNLQPGKEYFIKVKNKDKVFVEKSFFTSTVEVDKGKLQTYYNNNKVVVSATNVLLKSNEFYTITAKDAQGNVVFTKDSTNPNEEFVFTVDAQTKLYFSLAVSGATYSVSELDPNDAPGPDPTPDPIPAINPEYDYSEGEWTWAEDYSWATISFMEIHGLDPLVVQAEIDSAQTKWEDCEEDGEIKHYASVIESYGTYQDTKAEVIPALGHDYEVAYDWHTSADPYLITATCELTCKRDPLHFDRGQAALSYSVEPAQSCGEEEVITITASFESDGKTYSDTYVATRIVNHEPEGEITWPTLDAVIAKIDKESGLFTGSPTATYTCANCGLEVVAECETGTDIVYLEEYALYTLNIGDEAKEYQVPYISLIGDDNVQYTYDITKDELALYSVPLNPSVTELYVPTTVFGKTVKRIGAGAFANSKFTRVSLPFSIVEIGDEAFYGCTSLSDFTIVTDDYRRSNLTTIGAQVFGNCTSLTSVDLPIGGSQWGKPTYTGILTMGEGVFEGCVSLESLTIPVGKVEWFGRLFGTTSGEGFTACVDPKDTSKTYYIPTSLKTLTLDQGSEDHSAGVILDKEYYGITTIETVVFGARSKTNASSQAGLSIKTIGESAFEGCTNLTQADFMSVVNIGAYAFKNTALTSVVLDNSSVQSIGQGFLAECVNLTSLTVPFIADTKSNAVPNKTSSEKTSDTYLLGYFFGNTYKDGLTSVTQKSSESGTTKSYYIPSGLTSVTVQGNSSYLSGVGIYYGAFMGCTMITNITFGDYIDVIITGAFSGTTNLSSVTFTASGSGGYRLYSGSGDGSPSEYAYSDLSAASANVTKLKSTGADRWVRQ